MNVFTSSLVATSFLLASSAPAQESVSPKKKPVFDQLTDAAKRRFQKKSAASEPASPSDIPESARGSETKDTVSVESGSATKPSSETTPNSEIGGPTPSTTEAAKEKIGETADKVSEALGSARANRANTTWGIAGNYSFLDTWIPGKYGATISYNRSASSTYELEYLRGSLGYSKFGIDLVDIVEQRISALWRSYSTRNSFAFLMGVNYNTLSLTVGDTFLSTINPAQRTSVDVVTISTLGVTWGVGNRWQTQGGFIWGFDWFVINLPLMTLENKADFLAVSSDADNKSKVDDATKVLRRFPTFSVAKIQLGFSF